MGLPSFDGQPLHAEHRNQFGQSGPWRLASVALVPLRASTLRACPRSRAAEIETLELILRRCSRPERSPSTPVIAAAGAELANCLPSAHPSLPAPIFHRVIGRTSVRRTGRCDRSRLPGRRKSLRHGSGPGNTLRSKGGQSNWPGLLWLFRPAARRPVHLGRNSAQGHPRSRGAMRLEMFAFGAFRRWHKVSRS
jgi:hypothetical protein